MGGVRSIGTNEQLEVIADAHRLAILRRLMASPATLSQLGAALGHHAAWVRHHLLRLMRAGLVELAEERRVRNYVEKYYRATADAFTIHLLVVPEHGPGSLVALGSDDPALCALAGTGHEGGSPDAAGGSTLVPVSVGSLDGLISLRQGLADIAGCHLLDADTNRYNVDYVRHLFPDRDIVMVTLAVREQGLMVAPGNPRRIGGVEELARPDVRFVNRNRGSGTRVWLDSRLRGLAVPRESIAGYERELPTHGAAAREVAEGRADAALGIRAAAEAAGLTFLGLFEERYDLVMDVDRYAGPAVQSLLARLEDRSFRRAVSRLPGYDTAMTGREERVAV